MADTAKAAKKSAAKSGETKRKMLTPAEKVAKLEADLAAAREKAEAQANKKFTQLREQRAKLVEKRDALNSKIAEIDEQLPEDVEPDPIIAATGEDQATAGAEATES